MEGWPPLVAGLLAQSAPNDLSFHTPGHKQGRGAWRNWHKFLGENVFLLDLTELPGLDNLQEPQGIIKEASQAAAEFFGAGETFFLVNGATSGISAMLLAFCPPGGKVIIPRYCHQSVIHALILCGGDPVYLPVGFCPELGLPGAPETSILTKTLEGLQERPAGLVLTHPNYYGLVGELQNQVALAQHFGVPVLVDEAHGCHFGMSKRFPVSALKAGADVVVQSAHKILGAFTQAAFLHCRQGLDASRLRQALRLVQTTSPSYLLMSSLDIARCQGELERAEWDKVAVLGRQLRRKISRLSGLLAPWEEVCQVPGVSCCDPARLIVNVSGLGISGFAAASWLWKEQQIVVEMADDQNVILILSPPDLLQEERIVASFEKLVLAFGFLQDKKKKTLPDMIPLAPQLLSPREAFFASHEEVLLSQAKGRIAAQAVAPFPPGVPVIFPGEEISSDSLECLRAWEEAGGSWPGKNSRLIKVVAGS